MSVSVARNIVELAPRMRGWRGPEASQNMTVQLAEALGWTRPLVRPLRQGELSGNGWCLAQAMVGTQPAVVIAASHEPGSQDLVNTAALFAYHSSIEWGLATTPLETVVFNSHWIRHDDWYQLPAIRWEAPQSNIGILAAVTPHGVTTGRIDKIATGYYEPDKMLRPVDDALVDRLDYWRDEALRHSRDISQVDEKLQTLFAQLFVLRAIEDRELAPGLPTLEDALDSSGEANLSRLEALFLGARERIQSELFDEMVYRHFPPFVLAGIVRDLYAPSDLPGRGVRYNFSWVSADVLGAAYEKYLSTLLVPMPSASFQPRLFEQPLREVERVSVRKQAGVYYTPEFLVNYLTERALDHYYEDASSDSAIPRIADFSCGSGSFLTAAVDRLIRLLRDRDPRRNWGREIVDRQCVVGIDNDRRAVALARLSLWLRLAEEPDPLPLPRLEQAVLHGDSLSEDSLSGAPSSYDIILGNPPFIATGKFPSRQELAARFHTAQGRYDYAHLFIELAVRRLESNGVMAMVVPNRLFQNRNASTIRGILLDSMKLLTIVDFGPAQVFERTSAYVGAVIARKAPGESVRSVRVLDVRSLPPRFAAAALLEADRAAGTQHSEYMEAYDAHYPADPSPWLFLSPAVREARLRLERSSQPLGSLAGIYQGIRTGANDVFIVELLPYAGGPLAKIRNGLGDVSLVERDVLRPVVFGAEIRRYELIRPTKYLVYPYHANQRIREAELRQQFPRTYEYLSSYQCLLMGRRSTAASGLGWFELVRRRDQRWLTSSKLLIRDLAMEPAFALDYDGTAFIVGGTAVVPEDPSVLLPLLGYLNSGLADWYLRHITPTFRSGFQKFEPQHLQALPVPSQVSGQTSLSQELGELAWQAVEANRLRDLERQAALEDEIDLLLARGIGLDVSEVR